MDTVEGSREQAGGRPQAGLVLLVGAGPGDPDLLTVRALREIRNADVVLHDNLVDGAILALLPPGAERIFVGKQRGEHSLAQQDINELLVRLARAGRRVLRLKSGDPLVFGRAGEELEALAAAGIPFEIVPGITAAAGAAAALAIPLTHRVHAPLLGFVSAHQREGAPAPDWNALAQPGQTLAVYMGLQGLGEFCDRLLAHGRDPATPAAVVQMATRPGQRVVLAPLAELPGRVATAGLRAPTVTLIGEAVGLRERLVPWLVAGKGGSANPGELP